MLLLRALDPRTEQPLFEQAYRWRSHRRDRMPFAEFAKDDSNQIALGLFNGELIAVYFFHSIDTDTFQAHFTSRRGSKRAEVVAGATQLVNWFRANGLQMVAFVSPRNTAIRRFVEQAGLSEFGACQNDTNGCSVSPTPHLWVEYRSGR
mgnify:CR=1 FL=1